MNSKIDLHMHSRISDGTDWVPALLRKIQKLGITTFALTDHDTIKGALRMQKIVPDNIQFIRGVELSCKTEIAKCHILGYNYDPANKEFREFVAEAHAVRRDKTERRIQYLTKDLGFTFTEAEIAAVKKKTSPSKSDFAELIMKRLQKEQPDITKGDIFATYFKKLPDGRVDAIRGIKSIKAAGGIAVWAHPLGGTGEKRLTEEQFQAQLDLLCSVGLDGLECYYSEYTQEEIATLCNAANQKNLKISGGSDYHGTGKPHLHLGMLNKEDMIIAKEKLTILKLLQAKLTEFRES
jgi:hypothetical protein